ncbi:MAG: archaetidylserine decarboxylase, partial [Xanthomonadaceae bacterium]|nr:archaetidylserine decarboxylase [Xanthomonadaceae bacterium]
MASASNAGKDRKDPQEGATEDRWAHLKTWHQHLLPQHALTALANLASNSPLLRRPLIGMFTRLYPVKLAEAERSLNEFISFDDFFTRSLKPDARPLPANPDTIVSPSDGLLSRLGPIRKGRIIQAKGRDFSVDELLANSQWARHFDDGGQFATIYLAPHDYHRVHMPLDGRLVGETRVPGRLFSVSSATSQSIDRLYARNERMAALFETRYGPVVVVLVAALLVAG